MNPSSTTTRHWFKIVLKDDTIFSNSMRTTGGQHSLPYVTGASLYGAVAAQLYNHKDLNSYSLFYSGQVRFGNGYPAYPLQDRSTWALAYPAPLVLGYPKEQGLPYQEGTKALDASKLFNSSAGTPPEGIQYRPFKEGFISNSGRYLKPRTRLDTKSAQGRDRVVQTGQLFTYESLCAGQTFIACVEFDDIEQNVITRVTHALEGELLLGRSRSAQFASCTVKRLDQAPDRPNTLMG